MPTLAAVQSSCAFASPHHLDQALQRELTALATLEAAHRSACCWLDEWPVSKAVKEDVACRLEARHRAEREAHVLRLADLHLAQGPDALGFRRTGADPLCAQIAAAL